MQELKNLDGVLECPICFDYINIAMLIQHCSHTFCSLCIRRFLSRKNKCPVCNEAASETDLLNNRLVDEIIVKFKDSRSRLLQNQQRFPNNNDDDEFQMIDGKNKYCTDSKGEIGTFSTKIANFNNMTDMMRGSRRSVSKSPIINTTPTLTSTPLKSQRSTRCNTLSDIEMSETTGRFIKTSSTRSVKNSTTIGIDSLQDDTSTVVTTQASVMDERGSDNTTVTCPVCQLNIKSVSMNRHLDYCLERDQRKIGLRPKIEKRKPMTKVVYNLLSEKDLKKKLKDCGLSVTGSRQELTNRHHEFTLAYNAECDSLNPRPVKDIIKDVEKMDKLSKTKNPLTKHQTLNVRKNSSSEEINNAQKTYLKQHKSQFNNLVDMVRDRNRSKKQVRSSRQEPSSTSTVIVELSPSNKENQPQSPLLGAMANDCHNITKDTTQNCTGIIDLTEYMNDDNFQNGLQSRNKTRSLRKMDSCKTGQIVDFEIHKSNNSDLRNENVDKSCSVDLPVERRRTRSVLLSEQFQKETRNESNLKEKLKCESKSKSNGKVIVEKNISDGLISPTVILCADRGNSSRRSSKHLDDHDQKLESRDLAESCKNVSQDKISRRRSQRLDNQNKDSNSEGLVTNERTDLTEENSQRRSCSGLNDQNEKIMPVKKTNPAEESSCRSLRHSKIILVDENKNSKTNKSNSYEESPKRLCRNSQTAIDDLNNKTDNNLSLKYNKDMVESNCEQKSPQHSQRNIDRNKNNDQVGKERTNSVETVFLRRSSRRSHIQEREENNTCKSHMIEDPDITQRKSSRSQSKSVALHDKREIKKTQKNSIGFVEKQKKSEKKKDDYDWGELDLEDAIVISDTESESKFPMEDESTVRFGEMNCDKNKNMSSWSKTSTISTSSSKTNESNFFVLFDEKNESSTSNRDKSKEAVVRIHRLNDVSTHLSVNKEERGKRPMQNQNNCMTSTQSRKVSQVENVEKNKDIHNKVSTCENEPIIEQYDQLDNFKESGKRSRRCAVRVEHANRRLTSLKTCRQSRNCSKKKNSLNNFRKFSRQVEDNGENMKEGRNLVDQTSSENGKPPGLSAITIDEYEADLSTHEDKQKDDETPELIDRSISGTYENMSRSQNHVSPRNIFLENIYLGRQVKTNSISDGENDSNYDNNTGEVLMDDFIADDQENTVANNLDEDQQTNICGDHDVIQEETQLYVDEFRSNLTSALQDSFNIESVTTGAENSDSYQTIEMENDKQLLLPVPVFYDEMENSEVDSDIFDNVINGTVDYDISDVDEDNDPIQTIWPALSQCNIIGEQGGSTSASKDQPRSILTPRRHRHTSGLSISSLAGDPSLPLITPDKIRHTSELSGRLGDVSGNSAMSAVIPHVGGIRVVNSAAKRCLENEQYNRSYPVSPVRGNKRKRTSSSNNYESGSRDDSAVGTFNNRPKRLKK